MENFSLLQLLQISAAGALGTALRALLFWVLPNTSLSLWSVNLIGSLVGGVFLSLPLTPQWVTVGVLGGFTTFSAVSTTTAFSLVLQSGSVFETLAAPFLMMTAGVMMSLAGYYTAVKLFS